MGLTDVVADAYRGALPVLFLSALGGLFAGTILGGMDAELRAVPGLLVMVPAFLAIRGSVYGSLGSRLSSALHQGLITPVFEYEARLARAMVAAVCNGVTASAFGAVLTFGILTALDHGVASLGTLLLIAVVGGLLAGVILTALIVVVVFVSYRRGLDPDNLVGPAMTTAGDVFGMATLFAATRLALAIL